MPWEFHASCPDCRHEWDAWVTFERIADSTEKTAVRRYFCPTCLVHLSIATDFDRISFRNWLSGNQRFVSTCRMLAHNIALIQHICDNSTGYLMSLDSLWNQLWCPDCQRALVAGSIDQHSITCPNCGKGNAISHGCHAHVSTLRPTDDLL